MRTRTAKSGFIGRRKSTTGFTLVELLVVIAILGILLAMMVPAAGLILKQAKKSTAKSDAGIVATVMQKYQTEYNRWPGFVTDDLANRTDADWVAVMSPTPGKNSSEYNLKRVIFFEPGGGALNDAGAFVDPWGNPYAYQVDMNRDGMMTDPETGEDIRAQVLVWSAGPDGDYETWLDPDGHPENIKGWE